MKEGVKLKTFPILRDLWTYVFYRHYIGLDIKGANVPIPRAELIAMVESSESSRLKLFKAVEVTFN